VRAILRTERMRTQYSTSTELVVVTLSCSSVLALVLAVLMLLLSLHIARRAEVLRWEIDHWRLVPRRPPEGQFHT
jgi:hypothetical protein